VRVAVVAGNCGGKGEQESGGSTGEIGECGRKRYFVLAKSAECA
jgi:hypothetical protein